MVKVMYGTSVDGYSISEEAETLYKQLSKSKKSGCSLLSCTSNHDPLRIEVYRRLGKRFTSDGTSVAIADIPDKYVDSYRIKQKYDDSEKIVLDPRDLVADTIKNIDFDRISDEDAYYMLKGMQEELKEYKRVYEDGDMWEI